MSSVQNIEFFHYFFPKFFIKFIIYRTIFCYNLSLFPMKCFFHMPSYDTFSTF